MKLTIVYDNDVYKKDIGLKSDWGFSCLIETEDETVLFDTGARGNILLSNMEKLGIDPRNISKIAISHEHWDHSGGLRALAPLVGDIELYRLAKESPSENMRLISVEEPQEITKGVYTTGRLNGPVDEQSLVLKGEKGWYVVVGCSHPGVEKILDAARRYGNIVGLIGGLHGFNNFVLLEGLGLVCASHCTQHKKRINELFPNISIEGGVGRIIRI
ncbi:MAG: MBL fold metallo-hydrolase [Thermoplasmatales archaeon]|nr:MBL fold metallo-hydrolase [Thermoplasmatales archaeon]